ncbi:MAG: hypothetical protein OEV30_05330 [Ignavibacteria bacterium]|nr:hypothetical protein [Ignavibacteria bacterium]
MRRVLRIAALSGNILFLLWIVRNGINEGFAGTLPEIASYVLLIVLILLNTVLLYRQDR